MAEDKTMPLAVQVTTAALITARLFVEERAPHADDRTKALLIEAYLLGFKECLSLASVLVKAKARKRKAGKS